MNTVALHEALRTEFAAALRVSTGAGGIISRGAKNFECIHPVPHDHGSMIFTHPE